MSSPANWTPASWRDYSAAQQPAWPDSCELQQALKRLSTLPPLVFAGESRNLAGALAEVQAGRAFLLQAGDCAESFEDFTADVIRDKLKVILQMAAVLTYGSGVPTVKVGRIAGQFAKPRSSDTETRDNVTLPSFRGDLVNQATFSEEARTANPFRMVAGYHQSASTLNLLRAFTRGGFADLSRVQAWNQEFVASSPEGRRYAQIGGEIERALRFMAAIGIDLDEETHLHQVDLWTSHEALLLGYEEALTRRDSTTGDWYDCSAHMVWIGERTRQIEGAHVHFMAGINNPVGVKLGPTATPEEALALCNALNPHRLPGRLTFIVRAGAGKIEAILPPMLRAVQEAGHPVVWACDPMHGNTYTSSSGHKTRAFDDVLAEVTGFFMTCRENGAWPGGIHCELTGDDVTECVGGADQLVEADLANNYATQCDPRLNARQSLDLAFLLAEMLQAG